MHIPRRPTLQWSGRPRYPARRGPLPRNGMENPAPPNSFQQIHDHDPTLKDDEVKVHGLEHYAQQIRETADKLMQDRANRGDVKLLSVALRELRYSFKVLAAYRNHR